MLINLERKPERASFEEAENGVVRTRGALEQVQRLHDDRLAQEKRGVQFPDVVDDPPMMPLGAVKECNKRSGINDCDGCHGLSPRDA